MGVELLASGLNNLLSGGGAKAVSDAAAPLLVNAVSQAAKDKLGNLAAIGITRGENGNFIIGQKAMMDPQKTLDSLGSLGLFDDYPKAKDRLGTLLGAGDYRMSHRPLMSGVTADDLTKAGIEGMSLPKDVYDHPQYYTFMYDESPDVMNEVMSAYNSAKGNPNAMVSAFRAVPAGVEGNLNVGDWITLSPTYAQKHLESQFGGIGKIIQQQVPASAVHASMDDLAESGYYPASLEIDDKEIAPALRRYVDPDPTYSNIDLSNINNKPSPVSAIPPQSTGLSPAQEAFFKDSVIRDKSGNLIPMYHGTKGDFTVFGANAPSSTSNNHSSVGHWFTPNKQGAKNFADSIWYGEGKPKVMETYLNVKNPKIYETVDNSDAIGLLKKELDELEVIPARLSDTKLYSDNMYNASMVQQMINQGNKDTAVKWLAGKQGYDDKTAAKLVDEIAGVKELADKKKALQDKISELRYGDSYQQFKTDIYKEDGQTAEDANAGGIGMVLNDKNSIKRYVDRLRAEGHDGIIIRGTNYDADVMGGVNDQYVVFDPEQIKSIDNLNPTSDPDIYDIKSITPEQAFTMATKTQENLNKNLRAISEKLGFPEYQDVRQKSLESIKNKIERKGGDYTAMSMKDHSRSKITMNSWDDIPQTLEALQQAYPDAQMSIENVRNKWGYNGLHVTFREPNGIGVEVQLTTADHWPVKLESDAIYDNWRTIASKDPSTLEPIVQKRLYAAIKKSQALWKAANVPDLSKYANV